VLAAHGGRTALEYKYDGARIQLHHDGARVSVWSRRLSDVTRSLPDVVGLARGLGGAPFILDGEVVALDPAGRPLPFQELMRRFRRTHEVEALAREMPLAIHFFDCVMVDGRSLIDEPYARRWEALARVTDGAYLAERLVVEVAEQLGEAAEHLRAAVECAWPGGEDFDQESARERRIRRECLEVGTHASARQRDPAVVARCGPRREDRVEHEADSGVVRGEEALLLVAEVFVEGLAGDAGAGDDVGDRGGDVALARHGVGHRTEHPPALGREHHVALEAVRPARESAWGRSLLHSEKQESTHLDG